MMMLIGLEIGSRHDPMTKWGQLSCTGYLITYANCPIMWGSKMQSLVALSTMEAELIAMSTALCEVIHLQNLLLELCGCNFPIPFTKPQVACHTFEGNTACIEVAQLDHKICPRTKHISVRLFHFHDHIKKGLIMIEHVPSKYQLANIFTKPLPHDQYMHLRDQIMGWTSTPLAQHERV